MEYLFLTFRGILIVTKFHQNQISILTLILFITIIEKVMMIDMQEKGQPLPPYDEHNHSFIIQFDNL